MKKNPFFERDKNGKIKINYWELMKFLADSGFGKMRIGDSELLLVQKIHNIVTQVSERELVNHVKDYLISINEPEVLEKFVGGLSGYLNHRKYDLLPEISGYPGKESREEAWLYYQNTAVRVTAQDIKRVHYNTISHPVWDKAFLERDFHMPNSSDGDFKDFCYKLAKENPVRFLALMTAIGYLLHRHNDPGLCKVIILVDENIQFDGTANGGTGKSLIAKALFHCRNLVFVEGKNLKAGSWFKNQRIQVTTDIVCYDDVGRNFSLEELYSMSTSGVVIEKKYKDEIHLSPEDSPKFMISSNYIVKGTGGSSDIRRRYEFELANYFSDKHQPIDEYGDLFFSGWDSYQWHQFDLFMMECLQAYLKHGLKEAKSINLKRNRLINSTNLEFEAFSRKHLTLKTWHEKPKVVQKFNEAYSHLRGVSSHQFTKWIKEYCRQNDLEYTAKKSGEKYLFYLNRRKEGNDEA